MRLHWAMRQVGPGTLLLLSIAYWMFVPFRDILALLLALAIAPQLVQHPKNTDL